MSKLEGLFSHSLLQVKRNLGCIIELLVKYDVKLTSVIISVKLYKAAIE